MRKYLTPNVETISIEGENLLFPATGPLNPGLHAPKREEPTPKF